MNKVFQALLAMVLGLFITTNVAYANAYKVNIPEGADLSKIKTIAISSPLYIPTNSEAPSLELLTQILYDASKVTKLNVLSYDRLVGEINSANSLDMKSLNRRDAANVFKANVQSYADTYMVLTVANNSRTIFFFDVFKAGSNELLYTYEIRANRSEEDSVVTFNTLVEKFYKRLQSSIEDYQKKS